jgi:hypothetical protein
MEYPPLSFFWAKNSGEGYGSITSEGNSEDPIRKNPKESFAAKSVAPSAEGGNVCPSFSSKTPRG